MDYSGLYRSETILFIPAKIFCLVKSYKICDWRVKKKQQFWLHLSKIKSLELLFRRQGEKTWFIGRQGCFWLRKFRWGKRFGWGKWFRGRVRFRWLRQWKQEDTAPFQGARWENVDLKNLLGTHLQLNTLEVAVGNRWLFHKPRWWRGGSHKNEGQAKKHPAPPKLPIPAPSKRKLLYIDNLGWWRGLWLVNRC